MSALDWIIIILYIALVVGMSYLIGRLQKNQDDYYLGGRTLPPWQVGTSMVANQVSAISLVGAPAFIAVRQGGGLRWLQYELAIPLAMIGIGSLLVPLLRSGSGVTIYEYLERRFGSGTRLIMSFIFLLSRSLATGVALLATSYVTSVCIDLPLNMTILIIGIVSLVYTALGGIKADIYSDILQLVVLWVSSVVLIWLLWSLLCGDIRMPADAGERLRVFDLSSAGTGRGNSYSFWPMFLGGLFLYISYYGCDQSQAQRLLATRDSRGAQKSLLLNGILRFPLVLTYCAVGVLIIPFMARYPEFGEKVMKLPPDFLMPHFFRDFVPPGLLGVIVAGVFAASMSSLDSAINSLSAATWDDFLVRIFARLSDIQDRRKIRISRLITVFWGFFATSAAIMMAGGADTVIELVNKIGSAFYGPIAGVFILGVISKRSGQRAAITGLISGVVLNLVLWKGFPGISWMWWNLTGFSATLFAGLAAGCWGGKYRQGRDIVKISAPMPRVFIAVLLSWFLFITGICLWIHFISL